MRTNSSLASATKALTPTGGLPTNSPATNGPLRQNIQISAALAAMTQGQHWRRNGGQARVYWPSYHLVRVPAIV
jgi:hypothetical protein